MILRWMSAWNQTTDVTRMPSAATLQALTLVAAGTDTSEMDTPAHVSTYNLQRFI